MSTGSRAKFKVPPANRGQSVWINGFLVLGLLVGALGSLLIAWQYHLDTNPDVIGLHFLALNGGYVLAAIVSRQLLYRTPILRVILSACLLAAAALLSLSFVGPPVAPGWRILGMFFVGLSAGSIGTSLLYGLEPWFCSEPAAALNTGGALFGAGCTLATLLVAATYFTGSVQIETALLAAVPMLYCAFLFRNRYEPASKPFAKRGGEERRRSALKDTRSVAAVLFSLLLFLQSGNEFVIAGWLPLFVIQRLGANPVLAILALATYFAALSIGRIAVRKLLPLITHRKLLTGSVLVAMSGYLLLTFAPDMNWVWPAAILVGIGFAPIYPLLAEIMDDRFSYHPGFYNGIFSVAITGALTMPWLIGYVDKFFGAQWVMLPLAFGSVAVAILVLLIMFEARLMGGTSAQTQPKSMARGA